jgi:hypothetical protein
MRGCWRGGGRVWRLAALAVPLVVTGCGRIEDDGLGAKRGMRRAPRSEEVAPSAAGGASDRMYLGRWYGTTSQGLAFAFTVEDGEPTLGVTFIGYAWQLPGCSFHDDILFDDPAPISEGVMAVQIEAPGSLLHIEVAFDDARRAHGTLAFTAARLPKAPTCMGTGEVAFAVDKQGE